MIRKSTKPKANWTTVPGAKVSKPREPRRLRQKSSRQRRREARYMPIRNAFIRQHPHCQVCVKMSTLLDPHHYSIMPSVDVHHKKGKIGELFFDTRFFMAVCRGHHEAIGREPAWAKKHGFIVDRYGK